MARYTKDQLAYIALALDGAGYEGLANTIYWWRSRTIFSHRETYAVMTKPKRDMPLYISHPDEATRVIAAARLSYSNRSKP